MKVYPARTDNEPDKRGSCFYNSLSILLTGNQEQHLNYRVRG